MTTINDIETQIKRTSTFIKDLRAAAKTNNAQAAELAKGNALLKRQLKAIVTAR